MIAVKPIQTEKTLEMAKLGKYSFWVPTGLNKYQVKAAVEKIFSVKVLSVQTLNKRALKKKNIRGRIITKSPVKKAIVQLKEGEKIDIFTS